MIVFVLVLVLVLVLVFVFVFVLVLVVVVVFVFVCVCVCRVNEMQLWLLQCHVPVRLDPCADRFLFAFIASISGHGCAARHKTWGQRSLHAIRWKVGRRSA